MTSPEPNEIPHLTRKQLRDIRNTAATPIIPADGSAPAPPTHPTPVSAPLPRPSEPADVPPAPEPDSSVDLEAVPRTRRQAREQERIRTASVPVITSEIAAAYQAEKAAEAEAAAAAAQLEEAASVDEALAADETPVIDEPEALKVEELIEEPETERPVLDESFGAELLAGSAPSDAPEQSSFDQLLARDTASAGSTTAANALILTQTADGSGLVAPVTATGELIVTGTFNLPEGLGSTGHAPGVTDGKDVDEVLIDGELPAASSPTPIAASAAVSTSKSAGEVIRPPAPEKGGRLMMVLAITAGALALALVGVLVLSFTTGVFG